MLLVDRDRDIRSSVGGVYQSRGTPLPPENMNDDSDNSLQNNTNTFIDEQINQS